MLWEDEHNKGAVVLSKAINDFKGFYVKVGQIIARTLSLSLSLSLSLTLTLTLTVAVTLTLTRWARSSPRARTSSRGSTRRRSVG